MRIRKFRVKGYRSLRDVTLEPLGDINTFYGPNGSGKSNVLDKWEPASLHGNLRRLLEELVLVASFT